MRIFLTPITVAAPCAWVLGILLAIPAHSAPTVEQALKMKPVQDGVDYDKPTEEQVANCTLKTTKGSSGWILRGPDGQILRKFLDSNKDKKIDLWCYYQDGIEVYRDVDANKNGRADQYRWLGVAGIRRGLDQDEDGTIDRWIVISPEEVSAEIVSALRSGDQNQFRRLLPTKAELKSLGLGPERTKQIEEKVEAAEKSFTKTARRQTIVGKKSRWVNFSGTRPGIIPAGTDKSTKDITVYENAVAMVESDGRHQQLVMGPMIRVDDAWRVIDLPINLGESQIATSGLFFNTSHTRTVEVPRADDDVTEAMQASLTEIEDIDKKLATETSVDARAKLHDERADLLNGLVESAKDPKIRADWIRQLADTLSTAAQSGDFPAGIDRLKSLEDQVAKTTSDRQSVPFIRFRYLTASYSVSLQQPDADFVKIQEKWLNDLEQLVEEYPDSTEAAETMLQLGVAEEFAGNEKVAERWYRRIVDDFPDTMISTKASGAARRLRSIGREIDLEGKTVADKSFSLSANRGKVMLVHYWATWCDPCTQDLATIKKLYAKYKARGFLPVGVNVDTDRSALADFLKNNRLTWPQLYEDGGLDSRLANELGILSLPAMLLVDTSGKVVNRNVHVSHLEDELKKLFQ